MQIIVLELFMDLAASATFVAEPKEAGTIQTPSINPIEEFMNILMLRSLFLGAFSLFLAGTVNFLFVYYTILNSDYPLPVTFATWMFEHIAQH